jgi:CelD/BcsL family acetyltransferase involved in cellulose biosynthesis
MTLHARLEHGPFDGIAAAWERLHAQSPLATPFMSAGWARAWWAAWEDAAEPFTVVVRDGDEVVGLAPLVRRRRGPLRVLEPVGMDPGDYWDALSAAGREREVADAVAAALREQRGAWDAWILRCAPPASPVPGALDALPALRRPPIPAPHIALPEDFDAYLKGLSSSHRQNLRKHLRRLDDGEVELDEITDPARLPEVVERWQGFRRAQWEAQGKDINPEHVSPRFAAFMLACLRELLPAGAALVWEFRVDERVVGTYVNFADADAFYWYLGGFDPAVVKLGLGKIAIGHGIRTSIAAGRARYDFGRGAEPYKYWYGAVDRPLVARVVGNGSARSRLALAGARAVLSRRG